MKVVPVAVNSDNYAYLIVNEETKDAWAVDPAQWTKVAAAADALGVTVRGVLTTHKHWDHADGNGDAAAALPDVPILGGSTDVRAVTDIVKDGQVVETLPGLRVECLHTPCHTREHMLFLVNGKALFTGDTLFIGGCGRFFEGTAGEMLAAMDRIAALADDIDVWVGHEYTAANLRFAASVDGDNEALKAKIAWTAGEREAGRPTVPSTVAGERSFNPFMRTAEPAIQKAVGTVGDREATMAALREAKNNFK